MKENGTLLLYGVGLFIRVPLFALRNICGAEAYHVNQKVYDAYHNLILINTV